MAGNLLQGMEIREACAGTGLIVDNQVRLLGMILKLFMLASWAVMTLTAQEPVQPNLDGLRYPVLARSARIQGTVEFLVKSDGIQLVSGHPILAAAAKSNLEKWAVPHASDTPLSVTYIFHLTNGEQITEADEPIGDRFDRFFLRIFHLPVSRRVKKYSCIEPKDHNRVLKSEMNGGLQSIEIDVESGASCLNTDVVAIASVITAQP